MPILIGEKPGPDFRDPLGLLADCHRRIEKFLKILGTVTHHVQGARLDAEQYQALDVALRYFRESAPKHAADEEESLFPRMLSNTRNAGEATSLIKGLDEDHRGLNELHKQIDDLGRRWLAADRLTSPEIARFAGLIAEVREVYARHISQEESELYPLAASLLEADDFEAIAAEMAQRRGLVWRQTQTPTRPRPNDRLLAIIAPSHGMNRTR